MYLVLWCKGSWETCVAFSTVLETSNYSSQQCLFVVANLTAIQVGTKFGAQGVHSAHCINIALRYYPCFQPAFSSVPPKENLQGSSEGL